VTFGFIMLQTTPQCVIIIIIQHRSVCGSSTIRCRTAARILKLHIRPLKTQTTPVLCVLDHCNCCCIRRATGVPGAAEAAASKAVVSPLWDDPNNTVK
jgi:hypothetical protein